MRVNGLLSLVLSIIKISTQSQRESQPAGSSFSRTFKDQRRERNKKAGLRSSAVKQKSPRALALIRREHPTHRSKGKGVSEQASVMRGFHRLNPIPFLLPQPEGESYKCNTQLFSSYSLLCASKVHF